MDEEIIGNALDGFSRRIHEEKVEEGCLGETNFREADEIGNLPPRSNCMDEDPSESFLSCVGSDPSSSDTGTFHSCLNGCNDDFTSCRGDHSHGWSESEDTFFSCKKLNNQGLQSSLTVVAGDPSADTQFSIPLDLVKNDPEKAKIPDDEKKSGQPNCKKDRACCYISACLFTLFILFAMSAALGYILNKTSEANTKTPWEQSNRETESPSTINTRVSETRSPSITPTSRAPSTVPSTGPTSMLSNNAEKTNVIVVGNFTEIPSDSMRNSSGYS